MEVSVSNQLYVFFAMFVCGICSGLLFDIIRILRRVFGANIFFVSFSDILFWALISAGVYFAIFEFNYGQIRWYEIMGIILGSVIYFLTFSGLIMKILSALLEFFTRIFQFIFKIILTPLVFLYKMIKRPLFYLAAKSGLASDRVKRFAKHLKGEVRTDFNKLKLVMKKS